MYITYIYLLRFFLYRHTIYKAKSKMDKEHSEKVTETLI